MDKMEWVDGDDESKLFLDGKEIAYTYQGISGLWWWFVTYGDWSYAETREFAKAEIEKEVGK